MSLELNPLILSPQSARVFDQCKGEESLPISDLFIGISAKTSATESPQLQTQLLQKSQVRGDRREYANEVKNE